MHPNRRVRRAGQSGLGLRAWSLIGCWRLEVGISARAVVSLCRESKAEFEPRLTPLCRAPMIWCVCPLSPCPRPTRRAVRGPAGCVVCVGSSRLPARAISSSRPIASSPRCSRLPPGRRRRAFRRESSPWTRPATRRRKSRPSSATPGQPGSRNRNTSCSHAAPTAAGLHLGQRLLLRQHDRRLSHGGPGRPAARGRRLRMPDHGRQDPGV